MTGQNNKKIKFVLLKQKKNVFLQNMFHHLQGYFLPAQQDRQNNIKQLKTQSSNLQSANLGLVFKSTQNHTFIL